jgi:hypothetical protein
MPFAAGARILARERIGQMHLPVTLAQVARVQQPDPLQMAAHRRDQLLRKHRDAVLLALAVAHQHLAVREIHVLDSQPQTLHHPQTRAVKETRDQPARSRDPRQQPLHLGPREHHRNARRARGPLHPVEPGQLAPQHLAIQEQDRRQRLVLRRRRDMTVHREMIEERRHLRFAHRFRVALAVKVDEPLDPVHIRFLRAPAVVAHPDRFMHPLQQTRAAYLGIRLLARPACFRRHSSLPKQPISPDIRLGEAKISGSVNTYSRLNA